MNLPNAITLSRLLCVPLVVWLILVDRMAAAFWISLGAALSDAVDGIIAKRWRMVTKFGGYLDPIADKALLVCIYVALVNQGHLPVWLVILVVFRDALIIGGALLFMTLTQTLDMKPLMVSKLNTVMQLTLAVEVLAALAFSIDDTDLRPVLVFSVAATTLASGAAYVVGWTRLAAEIEKQDGGAEDRA
ncbi:MAG: CDP-alcohol phosphatidyltransferase family protein [Rhodospirillaceae bacterium]